MFRPRPMLRVDILLLQDDLARVVASLASAGIFHLGPVPDLPLLAKAESARKFENEGLLQELDQLLGRLAEDLHVSTGPDAILELEDLSGWRTWAESLFRALSAQKRRRDELEALKGSLEGLIQFLQNAGQVSGKVEEIIDMKFAFLTLGYFPAAIVEGPFEPPAGIQWEILQRTPGDTLVVFFGNREEKEALNRFLNQHRFRPLAWPRGMKGDFPGSLERLKSLLRQVGMSLERLERKMARMAATEGDAVFQKLRSIRIGRSLMDIYRQCGFTSRVAMIGGWIPGNRLILLEKVLNQVSPGRFSLHQEAAFGSQTPVLLSNPRLIRPFERILAVYGTPSYGELEPTPILALGFLILFGMMFGDLGHGLVFIVAGLALRRLGRFRDEGCILAEMGAFASVFGILYGSFFGLENFFEPLWFNPMNNIPAFMGTALAVGAGGILVGLLLRVWNGLPVLDSAFFTDPLGLAGLVFYAGALGTGYLVCRGLIPAGYVLWLTLPLIAIFLHPLAARRQKSDIRHSGILLAEGAVEVLETVLGFLANTFSFLRVAAFGLAHVGLATAVFVLAEMTRGWPFGWAWMVAVHVVGNLVILVLEGLVVSIQTVRLEFYEIFSKFFQGGGVTFRPLSLEHLPERSR